MDRSDLAARAPARLLIAFIDLTRYTAMVARAPAEEVAETLDAYYYRVAAAVEPAGGRVVKYIGDAALVVFPVERTDAGVRALLALSRELDAWLKERGWESRPVVKAHVGTAIAGAFGPEGRFDVLGADVNVAATLDSRGFALSAEAFRALAPETRARFKKHTPPITYIRVEDRRPHRTGRDI
jgi:adenylate cyclase